ncbi:hypothetical protein GNP61_08180 [Aliivibrio fischeri]|uniref:hypothetical protein n=1 Tax=Aliivibrio fischeri TaxID=668 RepID=UPI0012DA7229|nr:hypothetical protein [Aliivibrio fischeri]MUK41538.1 hypothetical protein [Aliivibrio fischeri]
MNTYLVRLNLEDSSRSDLFFGVEVNNTTSFRYVRLRFAYLLHLRSLFYGNSLHQISEYELLEMYSLLSEKETPIIQPENDELISNTVDLNLYIEQLNPFGISKNEIDKIIAMESDDFYRNFNLIKTFIINNLTRYHPWHRQKRLSKQPKTLRDWTIERQRIADVVLPKNDIIRLNVQHREEYTDEPRLFFGLKTNAVSFKQLRLRLAYLIHLRQLLNGDSAWAISEHELLELSQLLFNDIIIIQPETYELIEQSLELNLTMTSILSLGISKEELNHYIKERQLIHDVDNDLTLVKKHTIKHLSTNHPWQIFKHPRTKSEWKKEKERINNIKFTQVQAID